MIHIVDFGVGNLLSVANMLKRIGAQTVISSDPDELRRATRLVLPGVGAFDEGMRSLRERGLVEVLTERVLGDGVPILGVCLGMQLLGHNSEEGAEKGLGWIPVRFSRFQVVQQETRLKTLHMGWNVASPARPSFLFAGFVHIPRFYFVHRYYAVCEDESDVLAYTSYGVTFASAIGRKNVFGVQFHPEKSHRFGMQLYRNFVQTPP